MLPITPLLPPGGGDRAGKQTLALAGKDVWLLLRGIIDEAPQVCMTPSAFSPCGDGRRTDRPVDGRHLIVKYKTVAMAAFWHTSSGWCIAGLGVMGGAGRGEWRWNLPNAASWGEPCLMETVFYQGRQSKAWYPLVQSFPTLPPPAPT